MVGCGRFGGCGCGEGEVRSGIVIERGKVGSR